METAPLLTEDLCRPIEHSVRDLHVLNFKVAFENLQRESHALCDGLYKLIFLTVMVEMLAL